MISLLPLKDVLSTLHTLMSTVDSSVLWRTMEMLNEIMEKLSSKLSKEEVRTHDIHAQYTSHNYIDVHVHAGHPKIIFAYFSNS